MEAIPRSETPIFRDLQPLFGINRTELSVLVHLFDGEKPFQQQYSSIPCCSLSRSYSTSAGAGALRGIGEFREGGGGCQGTDRGHG